jgi:hypothetical protein
MIKRTSTGLPVLGVMADATAGTTQTQAGSTALTGAINRVTTGNANDGVNLPRGDFPSDLNGAIIVTNLSANALKVYPNYITADAAGDGSTIDGGAANAAITHAASTTRLYSLTANKTWKSVLIS